MSEPERVWDQRRNRWRMTRAEHGDWTRYCYGCRCAACNAANAARMKNRRQDPKWKEYYANHNRAYRLTPNGQVAFRRAHLKKYGLTIERVDQMTASQNGLCAICGERDIEHIDHNHATGIARDLLCRRCNHLLGSAEESPFLLRAAADYLEDHDQ